ncbi:MAG: ATP-binding protein [Verrucomicrobiota bacterium]|jgi:heavy metal sensor kinase
MTIRTRLSLWYAAVMFVALMVMGVLLYYQLVIEPRQHTQKHPERHHTEQAINQDIFEDVTNIVMWCAVPAVLLSIGGGWWLMKKSLAPVASLTQATKKISAYNLSERLPRAGNGDELDRLTEVFNGMLARLEDSFNRTREFTLHASHELKTPLTVLCGETETVLRDESLAPAERERAASQLDELHRLARIVDGLTLLARADAGQVTLTLELVQFDELVRDNFGDAQILAEPQGIQVELAGCEEATVRGDRHRLRQLLLNLADNAVKYNQPSGQVMISLRHTGDTAEFTIANTGPGIPPEVLPRVFDRFYRGDAAHSNVVDGCGLGLSIVQWIVSAHHGTIKIESVPSKITTVTVRLPLAQENKASL